MILNNPENRRLVTEYLEKIDEDSFIDDFVKPFFSAQGYFLFRVNSHGPDEHGKDLIFYRHIPVFYDSEYIAVQAKAEKVTTSNVARMSSQIERAFKTAFPLRTAGARAFPHYVIFVNARRHANEATDELNDMLCNYRHVKVLTQDEVCELIIKSGIAPISLVDRLSTEMPTDTSPEDREVYECLMHNEPASVDHMLDHRLPLIQRYVAQKTKEIVIEYIYQRWRQDRSWSGTVKPMRWLRRYFSFISVPQYRYFLDVFEELTSSYPSYDAAADTAAVAQMVTVKMLSHFSSEFIIYCADIVLLHRQEKSNIPMSKLRELAESGLVTDSSMRELMEEILSAEAKRLAGDQERFRELRETIMEKAHPAEPQDDSFCI